MRLLLIILSVFVASFSWAQPTIDQRTTSTKIADLLAKMPAGNATQYAESMQLIAGLDEKGLEQMALMLKDPQNGDNTQIEYALSGFSYYVTGRDQEEARKMAAKAYYRALAKTTVVVNRIFLIQQLEIVGKDDVIGYLLKYMGDPQLADPVVRALVKINTPAAHKALLNSFYTSAGSLKLRIVGALGDVQLYAAAPAITGLLPLQDKQLKKVVLYALASIAHPASLDQLSKEAAAVSFAYDTLGTTASYISYLTNLYRKGFKKEVDKAAWTMWNSANGSGAKKAKFAMLGLLTEIRGIKAMPLLMDALQENDRSSRVYALNLALQFTNDKEIAAWIKLMKTAGAPVKRDIVEMLGKSGNPIALAAVTEALDDNDAEVRMAAIRSAIQLGGREAQAPLINRLKDADPATIAAIKNSLLEMKGSGVNVNDLAAALPVIPGNAIPAVIEILSAKAASAHIDDVLVYLKSQDKHIQQAAFAALPSMATLKTAPALYSLLVETNNVNHIKHIQSAIVAATATVTDTTQRINNIKSALANAPASKQYLFLEVFAQIGSKAALLAVTDAYKNGDAEVRMAVVNALSNWTNSKAAEPLYQLTLQYVQQPDFDKVLRRYLAFISRSSFTGEQRLLELRRAMDIATTAEQRIAILSETGRCKTLLALFFAGKYLNDRACQQYAAQAVMQIAMADGNNWNGVAVQNIIAQAIPHLVGSDAEYQKKALRKRLDDLQKGEGFVPLFNGKNLEGWKGLVDNPIKRAAMTPAQLKTAQSKADSIMNKGWAAKDGILVFNGSGSNLCTVKQYGDFEMYVDWKITPDGDAGIYLRGSPQVQIWDTARVKVGAQVGSGGLYNNKIHPSKPLELADNAIGAWNSFYIKMIGENVTVYLNGKLVADNVVLENYWDKSLPIFAMEQIELQAHGTYVAYRDLYIREIPRTRKFTLSEEEKKEGYKILFDGTGLDAWQGNTTDYKVEQGELVVRPTAGSKNGNLYTKEEFSDFVYRFEFKLTPGANNGIGLRAPLTGDVAYEGLEVQMLDDNAPIYSDLKPYQYHGSVYGLITAKRGFLKPVGEWNFEEIKLIGNKITVTLNGTVILHGDIAEATKKGTLDKLEHPGIKRKLGHIAFLGHGDVVYMKNIRIRKL